ncbi:hypothetical protein KR032_001408 [Drosophila birchii]|nr:hypothetical protein KR032_001408 [Drosophila birchii]
MPLPTNLPVPHIVGDDEPDTNSPILPDHHLEADSCLSDSSCEYDQDVFEEASSSSSDGADWSMNVTRIAATPGHVPTFDGATPRLKSTVVVEERLKSPIFADEDKEALSEMEVEMPEPSLFSFLNLQPKGQATTKRVNKTAGVAASTSSKDDSSPKPGSSSNLGNASAAAHTRSVRSLRSASGTMSKRLVGRAGRILRMRTRGNPDNILAKPLDITAYFRVLSANLVRNRITRNSFQFLRDNIDRLLFETYEDLSLIPKSGHSSY